MAQSPHNALELFELAALLRRNADDTQKISYREQLRGAAADVETRARALIADGRKKGGAEVFGPVNLTV